MDIVDIIFSLPEKLVDLMSTLKEFMFSSVNINGTDISFWALLSGVAIIGFIILSIVNG